MSRISCKILIHISLKRILRLKQLKINSVNIKIKYFFLIVLKQKKNVYFLYETIFDPIFKS